MGPLETQGDLDGLVMRQEGAVAVCDASREALVGTIDAHNKAVKPRRIWPF